MATRAVLLLTAAILGVTSLIAQPAQRVAADPCSGSGEKDAFGPNGSEGSLFYVYDGCGYIHYEAQTYNGWGGVSWISADDLRTWVCGGFTGFDQSYTLYNTNYVSESSPDWYYGNCGPQSDVTTAEGIDGSWGWSAYLNF
ncbi:MAG: hypothetical protein JOZ75_08150 [Candidatus Dormibacteraeota bacterium]|nr:hypothetical protein [Candidatus Dormibacteraeota bacterium]